jgi:hypothetical protein
MLFKSRRQPRVEVSQKSTTLTTNQLPQLTRFQKEQMQNPSHISDTDNAQITDGQTKEFFDIEELRQKHSTYRSALIVIGVLFAIALVAFIVCFITTFPTCAASHNTCSYSDKLIDTYQTIASWIAFLLLTIIVIAFKIPIGFLKLIGNAILSKSIK